MPVQYSVAAPPVLVRTNLLNLKRDGKICNISEHHSECSEHSRDARDAQRLPKERPRSQLSGSKASRAQRRARLRTVIRRFSPCTDTRRFAAVASRSRS